MDALRARLSEEHRTRSSGQQKSDFNPQSVFSLLETVLNWVKQITPPREKRHQLTNTPLPTLKSQAPQPDCSQPGQEVLHLLLCIDKGESLTRLHQDRLCSVNGDKDLFAFLRVCYHKHRKFASWFTLRSVKSVSLTRVCLIECDSLINTSLLSFL